MNSRNAPIHAAPTAVLAEDELLLADELTDLLHTLWPQLQIVARAGDGVAALNAIEAHAPDLAFLDIHMPLLTGIEVATRIAGRCHVAFITSYDQHALEAFEAGAIDYVLKPPTAARLLTTGDTLTAYDAAYVTLAEALAASLVTTDGGLARAHGHLADVQLIA